MALFPHTQFVFERTLALRVSIPDLQLTFSIKALDLVQHWSCALCHPNHLASLLKGVISDDDDRRPLDKELRSAVGKRLFSVLATKGTWLSLQRDTAWAGTQRAVLKAVVDDDVDD